MPETGKSKLSQAIPASPFINRTAGEDQNEYASAHDQPRGDARDQEKSFPSNENAAMIEPFAGAESDARGPEQEPSQEDCHDAEESQPETHG
jgi:hypothetical protein